MLKEKRFLSLKDFGLSMETNVKQRSEEFQNYIDQMNKFETTCYWVTGTSDVGAKMTLEGVKDTVSAFISNDYLGMSQRPETIEAGVEALRKYGTGACAAQAIGGYLDIHKRLEKEIAEFAGQEDAILFSSGFGANTGLLRAILGINDIAYVDSYIHTSATSGLRGTNIKHIGHNDTQYLDMVLEKEKGIYKTSLVIIDGVYSQNGDLSKLPEYIEICKKHDCLLMVDDAHGIGVMGENGRGTAEYFNCLGQVDIITGTFSKSFGCVGGFIAASEKMVQYLRYYADSNVFSAAMTPQVAGSVLKAIELIKTRPDIRKKLWDNVYYLRKNLQNAGFDIGNSESPIFPIMVKDNEKVYRIADLLQKHCIFASGITYPAVRTKEARIRISVLASHEMWQLDHLVNTLISIRKEIDF
ncbi:aminotransferase class I/II-fold pyridoxal phosphate-dependent enzyme [Xylanibacter muris]|uniref:Aminotransferase class I/II-fold pyridoxal phosphate-dependent enzyme n=1 Tax=Xylanibacter muris TaxID=2736290 RepID=A0ABX2AS20_9BACT|nr:aminotransferase class I/II-fold pyridoxal phosphate-dependent enzyme [Xylanibacter muris]NPD93042.1 aminotransferase class I/II-fold pyridoxal phosphate-dependent enzyme [Xylanibacter muris]